MNEQHESFWLAACFVCHQEFPSDGEPYCGDIVCQAIMNRYFEHQTAVKEAELILSEHVSNADLVLAGL